ncbi:MAG: hypothetical protein J5738_03430 [Lachnospiraceae bacterium]|nr:hypothetical protein [Lachnospiraceae bacterium]
MPRISKKKFIIGIVATVLCVAVLWAILIIIISGTGSDSDHLSKKHGDKAETEKVTPDPEKEKENQKEDENNAEDFRHSAEVATAIIAVYDEAVAAIGDSDSYVAFFSVGKGGIKWEKDLPELASCMQYVYGDSLDDFEWKSEKYKENRYTVYYKSPAEGASSGGALYVIGRWEDAE